MHGNGPPALQGTAANPCFCECKTEFAHALCLSAGTQRSLHSFLLSTVALWNSLTSSVLSCTSVSSFLVSLDSRLIDHFTYYCLGSQGGKLWVAMRLLGSIACRKVCRNTTETRKTISLSPPNRRLPVSTFSPNHWSWRCHLLAPEIDRLASGAERACEIKEKKQPAIADAGAAAAAAQSEGETSSQRAYGSRKADRGTQETWGRNGASTCLLECENASSKGALSHTLFWERERKRPLAEEFISGSTLSVVQWEAGSTLPSLSPIIQVKIVQASTEERLALGYTSIPITLTWVLSSALTLPFNASPSLSCLTCSLCIFTA